MNCPPGSLWPCVRLYLLFALLQPPWPVMLLCQGLGPSVRNALPATSPQLPTWLMFFYPLQVFIQIRPSQWLPFLQWKSSPNTLCPLSSIIYVLSTLQHWGYHTSYPFFPIKSKLHSWRQEFLVVLFTTVVLVPTSTWHTIHNQEICFNRMNGEIEPRFLVCCST